MHLSLTCLTLPLLLARPLRSRSELLLLAPLLIIWMSVNPWLVAAIMTGGLRVASSPVWRPLLLSPSAMAAGRHWLQVATPMTFLFFWAIYLPAWMTPVVVLLWPNPART